MSTTSTNFNLNRIDPLNLNSVQIGSDINQRLGAINENFQALVESDYLKGAPGEGLYIEELNLNNESNAIINCESLATLLAESVDANQYSNIKNRIKDNLFDKKITLIKDPQGNLISSLPFIYKDTPQFSDNKDDIDASGVVWYQLIDQDSTSYVGEWKVIHSMPTIYFDDTLMEFCWKINNSNTGITARGIKGNDGAPGLGMTIACAEPSGQTDYNYEITQFYIEGKFEQVLADNIASIKQTLNPRSNTVVLVGIIPEPTKTKIPSAWYLSSLKEIIDDGITKYLVHIQNDLSLAKVIGTKSEYVDITDYDKDKKGIDASIQNHTRRISAIKTYLIGNDNDQNDTDLQLTNAQNALNPRLSAVESLADQLKNQVSDLQKQNTNVTQYDTRITTNATNISNLQANVGDFKVDDYNAWKDGVDEKLQSNLSQLIPVEVDFKDASQDDMIRDDDNHVMTYKIDLVQNMFFYNDPLTLYEPVDAPKLTGYNFKLPTNKEAFIFNGNPTTGSIGCCEREAILVLNKSRGTASGAGWDSQEVKIQDIDYTIDEIGKDANLYKVNFYKQQNLIKVLNDNPGATLADATYIMGKFKFIGYYRLNNQTHHTINWWVTVDCFEHNVGEDITVK